jgi:hypothetical protein
MLLTETSDGRQERLGGGTWPMPSLSRRDLFPLALPLVLPLGCATQSIEYSTRAVYMDPERATPGKLPFQTGQILLSEAPGPHGILFTLAPNRFFRFTHSALIVVDERGEPFVYDMTAEFKPTLATTPPDSLSGGVRRTSLADYVGIHLYVEVFDPPTGIDREKMKAKVFAIREAGTEFDAHWDFQSDQKLFCSEFIVEALAAGGAPRPPLVGLTENQSLRRVLTWFGVTSGESLPAAALPREKLVAAFSRWPTRAASEAYLEAKRELYRRFTPDQNIGDLLELAGLDVKLRPPVEAFLDRAPTLYLAATEPRPEAEIRARIRKLADEVLGPFPAPEHG